MLVANFTLLRQLWLLIYVIILDHVFDSFRLDHLDFIFFHFIGSRFVGDLLQLILCATRKSVGLELLTNLILLFLECATRKSVGLEEVRVYFL